MYITGVGIEGAEGRAASLAGDVSVRQFLGLARLLLVHGRRSAMRSAALCLFIVHRGLIVSTMQVQPLASHTYRHCILIISAERRACYRHPTISCDLYQITRPPCREHTHTQFPTADLDSQ